MNTNQDTELAKLSESSCDYFVSKGKVTHKYKGNKLRDNTRNVSNELNVFMGRYLSPSK